MFVDHKKLNTSHMDRFYQYPSQWSNTDDAIKRWLFVLPINGCTTRVFFLFHFKLLKLPFLPVQIPRFMMTTVTKIPDRMLMGPLLDQDRYAVEAEQLGYERHRDARPIECNPVVKAFQNVTVRRWRECLARKKEDGDAGL